MLASDNYSILQGSTPSSESSASYMPGMQQATARFLEAMKGPFDFDVEGVDQFNMGFSEGNPSFGSFDWGPETWATGQLPSTSASEHDGSMMNLLADLALNPFTNTPTSTTADQTIAALSTNGDGMTSTSLSVTPFDVTRAALTPSATTPSGTAPGSWPNYSQHSTSAATTAGTTPLIAPAPATTLMISDSEPVVGPAKTRERKRALEEPDINTDIGRKRVRKPAPAKDAYFKSDEQWRGNKSKKGQLSENGPAQADEGKRGRGKKSTRD